VNRLGSVSRGLRTFGAFWWDFIVGDDWRVAVGVVLAFAVTALLAHRGVSAWWVMPVAVLAILAASVLSAARAARRPSADGSAVGG
jgi:hypothetical protein